MGGRFQKGLTQNELCLDFADGRGFPGQSASCLESCGDLVEVDCVLRIDLPWRWGVIAGRAHFFLSVHIVRSRQEAALLCDVGLVATLCGWNIELCVRMIELCVRKTELGHANCLIYARNYFQNRFVVSSRHSTNTNPLGAGARS